MIDAALRQRIAPYFSSATVPTLQGVLDYLCMINDEMQEGEVWEPADPLMQAIDAYLDAAPDDPLQQISHDIGTVEVLIAAWGNKPLAW